MLAEQTSDPNHCWVRFSPRSWPGADQLWLDLFTRGLGRPDRGGVDQNVDLISESRDDVVYLPPVDETHEEGRRRAIEVMEESDSPLLVQILPGNLPLSSESLYVFDLLQVIATRQLEELPELPAGSSLLWPLVGGYTDDPGLWNEVLPGLEEGGVSRVQGLAADLSPADRRRIVEVAGDQGFDRLFHGQPPSEREFASAVHRFGMEPFLSRPLPKSPARLRGNRRLAEDLALIGELWLRLGRSESRGQGFYRAARWIDREAHDLMALAREGNLGVVTWLDAESRELVQEIVASGSASLLAELRDEYLGSSPASD